MLCCMGAGHRMMGRRGRDGSCQISSPFDIVFPASREIKQNPGRGSDHSSAQIEQGRRGKFRK